LTDVIMLYIVVQQGATMSCAMQHDFALNIKITVIDYS